VHSLPSVAAAQFAVDADDFPGFCLEVGEVRPGQFELGGPAPGRLLGGNLGSLEFEILEGGQITDLHTWLHVGFREWRVEHMQSAGAELLGSELFPTSGVQVELDRISVPDLLVGADVRRFLVETTQADVEVLLVPQVKELTTTVGKIRMADVNGSDKSTIPIVQLPVHRDWLLRLRNKTDDGSLLSVGGSGFKENDENGYFPCMCHL